MAHARRKFSDALQNDKDRAEQVLAMFQHLYAIERRIKEESLTEKEILALRQGEAVPVLQTLKAWMIAEYPKVLPKSPIGQAIGYFLPRWEKLCRYTTVAKLQIDNNPVENAIRPVAISRKNFLFAGSHDAAQRAAMVYLLPAGYTTSMPTTGSKRCWKECIFMPLTTSLNCYLKTLSSNFLRNTTSLK